MSFETINLEQALLQIQKTPHRGEVWVEALCHTCFAKDINGFNALVILSARYNRNRIILLKDTAIKLAELGRVDLLEIFGKHPSAAYSFLFQATLAQYTYLYEYDLSKAHGLYNDLLCNFPFDQSFADFSKDEIKNLRTLFLQRVITPLFGVEPADYTLSPIKIAQEPLFPTIAAGNLLILAACDGVYGRIYAENFIESITKALPQSKILIHLMNPFPEDDALWDGLHRKYPHTLFSKEQVTENIPYYAARRFMIAKTLREKHWDGDMIILDIDESLTPSFAQVVETVKSYPIALWQTRIFDRVVSGIYERVVFLKNNNSLVDNFLSTTHSYLQKKLTLEQQFWGWDGFSLFHSLCLLGEDRSQVLDMKEPYPALYDEIVPQIIKHEKVGQEDNIIDPQIQNLVARLLQDRFDPKITPEPFKWFLF